MKTQAIVLSILYVALGSTLAAWGQSAPDFTLAANPASVQMPAGGSTTSEISSSSLNGFVGSLQLACQNLPQTMTCTFTPVDLQLGQGGKASSQLIIAAVQPKLPGRAAIIPDSGRWFMSLVMILILGGVVFRRGRKAAAKVALLVLLPSLALLGGCQGLQSSQSHGQTYTIVVTASASDGSSQSVSMTVTVLQ
jgi:hypothetical protein